jgi:hypothetical protein
MESAKELVEKIDELARLMDELLAWLEEEAK